jgi:MoaA/NifB/PqqE/SkfB family radical SAM enzyme
VPSPFPAELQVETTTVCTAGCPYCPRSSLATADAFMDESLFADIVAQCHDGKPANLELYLGGEPLSDPRLERLADRAKAACPGSLVSIVTQVDALSEERAPSLADCGLDLVFASVNPIGDLDQSWLEPRLDRLARVASVLATGGTRLVVVSLVNLVAAGSRGRLRRLVAAHGLPFEAFQATSRAGDVPVDHYSASGPPAPPSPCERAFTRAFIRSDGEMVLCCEDFRHRRTFGSVRDHSIAELWTSPAYQDARQELLAGRPRPPCDRCAMGRVAAARAPLIPGCACASEGARAALARTGDAMGVSS